MRELIEFSVHDRNTLAATILKSEDREIEAWLDRQRKIRLKARDEEVAVLVADAARRIRKVYDYADRAEIRLVPAAGIDEPEWVRIEEMRNLEGNWFYDTDEGHGGLSKVHRREFHLAQVSLVKAHKLGGLPWLDEGRVEALLTIDLIKGVLV